MKSLSRTPAALRIPPRAEISRQTDKVAKGRK